MGVFNRRKLVKEERADTDTVDDVLLSALLGRTTLDKDVAMNIPSLNGCVEYIANSISMLPIKLYREKNGTVEEVKNDKRVFLLNDDTRDTLDSAQFWKAIIFDYFMGKGGYAYINRDGNEFQSIHYVDESYVSIHKGTDPIFKDYNIMVNGNTYQPYEFIKLLRKTKDGSSGKSILEDTPLILSVGYNTLKFEENLVTKGGAKKGFLMTDKKLSQEIMDKLKEAWRKLFTNSEEKVVVLNDGLKFQEASESSVEMQLNENKQTNSSEICKILNVPESIIKGTASETDFKNGFKLGVMPVIRIIEAALNRDFLLEREKIGEEVYYWSIDTKEMLKGDIKSRYDAYKTGLDANFLQIDEVRYMEDLPEFGLDWIKLGLKDVLYNPKNGEIYTPNTGDKQNMGNEKEGDKDED